MATMPGGAGAGGMITGDPDLQAAAAAAGVAPGGGAPSGPQYGPAASMWMNYFTSNLPSSPTFASSGMLDQAAGAPSYGEDPGDIGFGVLQPGGASGTPGRTGGKFYISPDAQDKRYEGFENKQGQDRGRLQGLANEILGHTASPGEVVEEWAWALAQVDAAEQMGADPMDPWHWLKQKRDQKEGERTEAGGAEPEQPDSWTETQTQKTLNLTDPQTAKALIDQTLRNALGRRATADEQQAFYSSLRAEEEANPSVSTTTTEYSEGSRTSSSTTETTGGDIDPGVEAQQYVDEEHMEEQQSYLAAQYLDALRGL